MPQMPSFKEKKDCPESHNDKTSIPIVNHYNYNNPFNLCTGATSALALVHYPAPMYIFAGAFVLLFTGGDGIRVKLNKSAPI